MSPICAWTYIARAFTSILIHFVDLYHTPWEVFLWWDVSELVLIPYSRATESASLATN